MHQAYYKHDDIKTNQNGMQSTADGITYIKDINISNSLRFVTFLWEKMAMMSLLENDYIKVN